MTGLSDSTHSDRRRAGFAIWKTVLMAGLGFAVYAAWCHLPALTKQWQLEGSIQNVLKHAKSHETLDRTIIEKALYGVHELDLPVGPEDIVIRRESREGERSIHVEIDLPIEITFLGSKKTLMRRVVASRRFVVDEALLAQREAERTSKKQTRRDQKKRQIAENLAFKERVERACGAHADIVTTQVIVTLTNGQRQFVDCDTVSDW